MRGSYCLADKKGSRLKNGSPSEFRLLLKENPALDESLTTGNLVSRSPLHGQSFRSVKRCSPCEVLLSAKDS